MKHRLIALLAATAVALTPAFAAPAAAKSKNNDDVWKFVLGAAALGLIINEVNKDKKRKAERRVEPEPYPYPGFRRDERRDRRWLIPPQCVDTVQTRDGWREVVSGGCMADFGLAHGLPRECAFDMRSPWGPRKVYGEACLTNHGYRIGQARR